MPAHRSVLGASIGGYHLLLVRPTTVLLRQHDRQIQRGWPVV